MIPTMSQRTRQGPGSCQMSSALPALTASRQPRSRLRSPGHSPPASIAPGTGVGVETRSSGATLPPSRGSQNKPNAKSWHLIRARARCWTAATEPHSRGEQASNRRRVLENHLTSGGPQFLGAAVPPGDTYREQSVLDRGTHVNTAVPDQRN